MVGVYPARQCSSLEHPAARRSGVVEHNAEKFALRQREDIEQINATGSEELARRGMRVNTADTESFRARLGDFYARWRQKAGPELWRLLESYADGIA